MKPFVTLVVLVAVVSAAYVYWWKPRQAASAMPAPSAAGIPGPGAAAGSVPGVAAPVPGSSAAIPTAVAGDQAPAAVPAAVKADYDKAEALWQTAVAAGDVVTSPSAPQIARLYSKVLQGLYNQPGAKALEDQLVTTRLTPLGSALFFTKTRYPDDVLFGVHSVVGGDNPDRIAKQNGMSSQQLNRLRNRDLNDGALRVGETLKVVKAKENGGCLLHADKSDYYVDVYVGGIFARRYDVSIGAAQSPTPVGKTQVTDLVFDPPWTDPKSGEVYPPKDPRNILGGVWIALSSEGIGQTGIGLHGYTGEDQTSRKQASNGCIRLGNEAIKELAYLIAHPNRSPTTALIVE